MTILQKIAYNQHQQSDVPNQELARELALAQDREGIAELVENLSNKKPAIQSDCLKVLYEIGYRSPELVAPYFPEFLMLLRSRNNRLVWGAMIALGTIAHLRAADVYANLAEIKGAMQKGSVITVDNGVKVLAQAAAAGSEPRRTIFPYLLEHLRTCRPKSVAQHAEKTLPAVDETNREAFAQVLETRVPDLSSSEVARVRKVLKLSASR